MTNEMESKRIGERIAALRKEKGMTQEEWLKKYNDGNTKQYK